MGIPRAFASSLSLALALVLVLVVTPLCRAEDVLFSGERLTAGNSLESGDFKLLMTEYCELYQYVRGHVIWLSKTYKMGTGCYLTLESDGNLVIYTDKHVPVWQTNKHFTKGQYVLIQRKEFSEVSDLLVMYGPHRRPSGIFNESNAGVFDVLPVNNPADKPKAAGVLFSGERLTGGNPLKSGVCELLMMDEICEVVLFVYGKPRWSSGAHEGSGCYLTLERDGNLVIYTDKHVPVWQTNYHFKKGKYVLILRDDGDLSKLFAIYGPHRRRSGVNEVTAGVFGVLPANNPADEPKAAGINMVANN